MVLLYGAHLLMQAVEDRKPPVDVGPSAFMNPGTLFSAKREMRRTLEERRAQAASRDPDAAFKLRDRFLAEIILPPRSIVAAYSKIGSEMDPAPLAEALRAQGHVIVLPVIAKKGEPLVFRRAEPDDPFAKGTWGIREPLATAPSLEPDIVLTPLLGFDRRFYRLGYGGGYYDRSLAELRRKKRIRAVGLAYAAQEVPEIPADSSHDMQLDQVATEAAILTRPSLPPLVPPLLP